MKKGSVMMEFVLTMPIMIVLLMLVLQFGLIWIAREQTAYAAYCAARSTLSYRFPKPGEPDEQLDAANRAAQLALSWVNAVDYTLESERLQIPGWTATPPLGEKKAGIPNSGEMEKWVSVQLDRRQGYCAAKVTYDYPLVIPIASRLISAANSGKNTEISLIGGLADEATKNGHYYITLKETCVLPIPYSCANLPKGGLL